MMSHVELLQTNLRSSTRPVLHTVEATQHHAPWWPGAADDSANVSYVCSGTNNGRHCGGNCLLVKSLHGLTG